MKKFARSTSLALVLLSSASATLVSAPAHAQQNLELYSCIYYCGAGPDGQGGVPADEYEACKATCEEIYGGGQSGS